MLEEIQDREVFWKPSEESISKRRNLGTTLVAQWLRLQFHYTGCRFDLQVGELRIPHHTCQKKKERKKLRHKNRLKVNGLELVVQK